jgi:dolichol kinase
MVKEIPFALLITAGVLLGLYLANLFYDYKIPQYISRKIGHLAGAVGFLICPYLFSSFWWPFILTAGFTGLLLYARMLRPYTFRGVGGSGRPQALAEVNFPAAGIVLIGVIWGIYDQPWLAIIPLVFMGAGDAVTGLIRSKVYGREVKGNWGSLGMLITCLLLAYFVEPYWLGAVGAIVAVLAEKFTPTTKYMDDNFSIPLVSGFIMLFIYLGIITT